MRPALLALLVTALVGCSSDDDDDDASLTIENESSVTLIEINLSSIDDAEFGPDVLGADVLDPGDVLVLSEIPCDVYDIRVVDEDGVECLLDTVDLCLDDSTWVIDDTELALCGF